jgi:hypothetical protein
VLEQQNGGSLAEEEDNQQVRASKLRRETIQKEENIQRKANINKRRDKRSAKRSAKRRAGRPGRGFVKDG